MSDPTYFALFIAVTVFVWVMTGWIIDLVRHELKCRQARQDRVARLEQDALWRVTKGDRARAMRTHPTSHTHDR